ncbi:sigma factor-like helix-turn-helix DNA-binding protein [Micromonospora psammae]|uniref:sigma factor-like helix-turn-helix DNA-binding protein n=1 Tax=Micromonospora sp. CPCC 205556 TaxID=3122398 RepID=UPI002FEF06FA
MAAAACWERGREMAACSANRAPARADDLEEAAAVFTSVRPRLFGIAYRMLSSVAEDLVQEVWLRWHTCDRGVAVEPAALLVKTTTRLAINALQSARVRRGTYIGPWRPEPVDTGADPCLGAERGEALEFAALLLMEKLTPNERAAYVLREAFDYPYAQVACVLQSTVPAVRQLVSRARKHLTQERCTPASAAAQRALLHRSGAVDDEPGEDQSGLRTGLTREVTNQPATRSRCPEELAQSAAVLLCGQPDIDLTIARGAAHVPALWP